MGITAKITKKTGSIEEHIKKVTKNLPTTYAGFLEGATYPNGQNVASVAYYNEYGRGHNPERPFLRNTVKNQKDKWVKFVKAKLKNNLEQGNIQRTFKALGEVMRADITQSIVKYDGINPTNKPATVEAKRRREQSGKGTVAINPEQVLIDTAMMSKSVSYEVKK